MRVTFSKLNHVRKKVPGRLLSTGLTTSASACATYEEGNPLVIRELHTKSPKKLKQDNSLDLVTVSTLPQDLQCCE